MLTRVAGARESIECLGLVEHIFYEGGEEAAPRKMPYLGGLSSVGLLQRIGPR
jgi:hypothetical protein